MSSLLVVDVPTTNLCNGIRVYFCRAFGDVVTLDGATHLERVVAFWSSFTHRRQGVAMNDVFETRGTSMMLYEVWAIVVILVGSKGRSFIDVYFNVVVLYWKSRRTEVNWIFRMSMTTCTSWTDEVHYGNEIM